MKRGQIVYGFRTPNGNEFFVPAGIKVLAVYDDTVKLQYQFGDIEIVSRDSKFFIKGDN